MSLSSNLVPIELPGHFAPLEELVPFSHVHLVAFDLDGTLLKTPDQAPGERVKQLGGSAKSFGVRLTLATGRTLTGAQNTLSALGDLGSTPIILYNGSLVIQPGPRRIIAHRQIDASIVKKVVSAGRQSDSDLFIYSVDADKDDSSIELSSWETVRFSGSSSPPDCEFNGMPVLLLNEAEIPGPATAILVLLRPDKDQAALKEFLTAIPEISITSSGQSYIEVRPFGSSKAAGMADVARCLNLQQSDVLAVGDNDNDVELLEWAGIGVAVKGASPSAMAVSDYVSHYGAERAAIEVLDLVRKAKRLNRKKRQE
jgi:Cof subfamily protein (haloacid dehalogenase superfamily)